MPASVPIPAEKPLNRKQECFVREYLVDFNATQAMIRAGYSRKTANQQGSDLLAKPYIQAAIERLKQDRFKRLDITADRVLQEYTRIAYLDPKSLFDDRGQMLEIRMMPEDARRAIAGVEYQEIYDKDGENTGRIHKIKIASKIAALDMLAKHLGLVNENPVQPGGGFHIEIYLDPPQQQPAIDVTE